MKRKLLVFSTITITVLAAYCISYKSLRSIHCSNTTNSCFETIGSVCFSYAGSDPQGIYALTINDARLNYLMEVGMINPSIIFEDFKVFPPPFIDEKICEQLRAIKPTSKPSCRAWYSYIFIPLERIELKLRGHTPVFLSDQDKANLHETFMKAASKTGNNSY